MQLVVGRTSGRGSSEACLLWQAAVHYSGELMAEDQTPGSSALGSWGPRPEHWRAGRPAAEGVGEPEHWRGWSGPRQPEGPAAEAPGAPGRPGAEGPLTNRQFLPNSRLPTTLPGLCPRPTRSAPGLAWLRDSPGSGTRLAPGPAWLPDPLGSRTRLAPGPARLVLTGPAPGPGRLALTGSARPPGPAGFGRKSVCAGAAVA